MLDIVYNLVIQINFFPRYLMTNSFQQLESFDYLLLDIVWIAFLFPVVFNCECGAFVNPNVKSWSMTPLIEDIKECLVIFLRYGNHCGFVCRLQPVSWLQIVTIIISDWSNKFVLYALYYSIYTHCRTCRMCTRLVELISLL